MLFFTFLSRCNWLSRLIRMAGGASVCVRQVLLLLSTIPKSQDGSYAG